MNKEHEKIKNKIMKPLIVIGVIIIPLMYSFFYLKAFWDPYSNLTGIPVALVNEDKGNEEENLALYPVPDRVLYGTFIRIRSAGFRRENCQSERYLRMAGHVTRNDGMECGSPGRPDGMDRIHVRRHAHNHDSCSHQR